MPGLLISRILRQRPATSLPARRPRAPATRSEQARAAQRGAWSSRRTTRQAGAILQTAAINTSGGTKGAGGAVVLNSASNVNVTSTITTTGGAAVAGGTHAGAAGGNVTPHGCRPHGHWIDHGQRRGSGRHGSGRRQCGNRVEHRYRDARSRPLEVSPPEREQRPALARVASLVPLPSPVRQ